MDEKNNRDEADHVDIICIVYDNDILIIYA